MVGDVGDLPEDLPDDAWWQQVVHRWEQLVDLARQCMEDADTTMVCIRGHLWSPSIGHHSSRLQQCHCALQEPDTIC